MKFKTKLWKRSEKSFASTIPHIALLSMNEEKKYEIIWEYNEEIGKWTFDLIQKENTIIKTNSNNKKQNKIYSGDESDE